MFKIEDYSKIKSLLKNVTNEKSLVFSVVEHTHNGDIYVDDANNPNYALIVTKVDFSYLVGNFVKSESFVEFLFDEIIDEEMVFFTDSDENCQKLDEIINSKKGIQIERKLFSMDLNNIQNFEVPQDTQLVDINNELAEEIGIDLSICDFNKHHFGTCLMKGEEVLSYCYSIFVTNDEAEIDIKTMDDHQKKGYASIVGNMFIKECVKRGKKPNWACWPFNEASIKLAIKLGFAENGLAKAYLWAKKM